MGTDVIYHLVNTDWSAESKSRSAVVEALTERGLTVGRFPVYGDDGIILDGLVRVISMKRWLAPASWESEFHLENADRWTYIRPEAEMVLDVLARFPGLEVSVFYEPDDYEPTSVEDMLTNPNRVSLDWDFIKEMEDYYAEQDQQIEAKREVRYAEVADLPRRALLDKT